MSNALDGLWPQGLCPYTAQKPSSAFDKILFYLPHFIKMILGISFINQGLGVVNDSVLPIAKVILSTYLNSSKQHSTICRAVSLSQSVFVGQDRLMRDEG